MNTQVTLLIPEKADVEFEQVFESWVRQGGKIKRLGKYWIKDEELSRQKIAIYGNQAFALVLSQIYNVDLISPDDTIITRLGNNWTKRDIRLSSIGQLIEKEFPCFIKPVIPKMFIAAVFENLADFKVHTNGLEVSEQIMISSIVSNIHAEARSYIKDGEIKDIALYEGVADLSAAENFLKDFLKSNTDELPSTVVIDLAYSADIGWFILEFNACWGAGLNNCKAENVIDCIISASVNKN